MNVEALTVASAITGLFAVSNHLADSLWNLNTHPVTETAPINLALRELKQYRSSLHVFYKTLSALESGKLAFPQRASCIEVDLLVALMTDTVLAISEFQTLCDNIEGIQESEDCEAVKLGDYKGAVTSLTSRLRWHNLSITMMMTVLKCPGEADAQSSKTGLSQRVTRLLSSNAQLAYRMRSNQDIYNARGQQTEYPPGYTPTLQPLTMPSGINYAQYQQHIMQQGAQFPQPGRPSSASPHSSISSLDAAASATHTWSVFSGYDLADISTLSTITVPITTSEVRDGQFYTTVFAKQMVLKMAALIAEGPESMDLPSKHDVVKVRKKKKKKEEAKKQPEGQEATPKTTKEKPWIAKVLVKKLRKKEKVESAEVVPAEVAPV